MSRNGLLTLDTSGTRGVIDVQAGSQRARATFMLPARHGAALRALHRALQRHAVPLHACTTINLHQRPGRFSSVRLGVIIANTIAWSTSATLSVDGVVVPLATPAYGRPPSITLPTASVTPS